MKQISTYSKMNAHLLTHTHISRITIYAAFLFIGVLWSTGSAWGKRAIVSVVDYATANSWSNGTAYTSIVLDANVTASASGTVNNGKYYEATPGTWRFYEVGSGSLTIATTDGTLNSVTLVFSVGDKTNGTISYSASALASKTACAVSGTSATFTIGSTEGGKGNIQISFIIVDYTPTSETSVFSRISSASELSYGDEIIFVNQDETSACGTTQNDNNRSTVSITTSSHSYTKTGSDNVQVFTVMKNGDNFGFFAEGGFIYAASTNEASTNYLKTTSFGPAINGASQHSLNGQWLWTLSATSDVFDVLCAATNYTNRYAAFNGTTLFSSYKAGQTKPYIYKRLMVPVDFFVDIMHDNVVTNKQSSEPMPTLSDRDGDEDEDGEPDETRVGKHYKFVGWVKESDIASDGSLKSGYTLYLPGSAHTADFSTYYAVWAQDVE